MVRHNVLFSRANILQVVKEFWQEAAPQGCRTFHVGKVNVTAASQEQCSQLQQLC